MKKSFNTPKAALTNIIHLANYCAIEIVEMFKACPVEKEIAAVERRLKQVNFDQLGNKLACKIVQLFQPMPTLKEIAKVEAVISKFYMAQLNAKPAMKAA